MNIMFTQENSQKEMIIELIECSLMKNDYSHKPSKRTIDNILNYSDALLITKTPKGRCLKFVGN